MGRVPAAHDGSSGANGFNRWAETLDDTLPFDFGLLEIDQETKSSAGGSQIVETLRRVFVGQALDTFQFHHLHVFDEDIGKVFIRRSGPCGLL